MEIALLTRGPGLYSSQSLYRACLREGVQPRIIDYSRCSLLLDGQGARIFYQDRRLAPPRGIIPRIGATFTQEGAALIRHFEGMGVPSTTPSAALVRARDKLHGLQILARSGVEVPVTVFAEPHADLRLIAEQVHGFPCIIKPLESTHGMGIRLVHTLEEMHRVLFDVFLEGKPVLIQEFIKEADGADIRVFVVDGQVAGAMKRVAKEGDFRSNLHQGGVAYRARLTPLGERIAIEAACSLGLGVAGVDMLESDRGPLVLEINASPGLEGIEKVTGEDIAARIVRYLVKLIEEKEVG
jgi:ribosomal protein S6--L-glutamate ligase